jgi:hypothetical protein
MNQDLQNFNILHTNTFNGISEMTHGVVLCVTSKSEAALCMNLSSDYALLIGTFVIGSKQEGMKT